MTTDDVVGVLALQGAFYEHVKLLRQAAVQVTLDPGRKWVFIEVRTVQDLERCEALVIPGGESTTVSLVAARSNILEPLRDFVKVQRKPTWGTCAGLILLAESANRTKKGGQDLIGGLDVRVNRNYFGRQTESFEAPLDLPFLAPENNENRMQPFNGIFIRAPVVEKVFPAVQGEQKDEEDVRNNIIAPARQPEGKHVREKVLRPVEVMAILPGRSRTLREKVAAIALKDDVGDIIAVRQNNVFGTSFHPELTEDARIHVWWLEQVRDVLKYENKIDGPQECRYDR